MLNKNDILNLLDPQLAEEIENKINDTRKKHFENVINEQEISDDDYEQELAKATQSYNRAVNPCSDTNVIKELQDALEHINKAKELENESALKQTYSDLLLGLEQSINEEMAKHQATT